MLARFTMAFDAGTTLATAGDDEQVQTSDSKPGGSTENTRLYKRARQLV